MSELPGSSAFYTLSNTVDTLKQYQGKYVCYVTNELGTAMSNEATLVTDGKNVLSPEATVGQVVGRDICMGNSEY